MENKMYNEKKVATESATLKTIKCCLLPARNKNDKNSLYANDTSRGGSTGKRKMLYVPEPPVQFCGITSFPLRCFETDLQHTTKIIYS